MIGEAAALTAALVWAAGSLLFERIAAGTRISPLTANFAKSVIGLSLLLGVWAVASRDASISQADLGRLLASGVVGIAIGDTAFFAALVRVGAARAVLMLSSAPLFVVAIEVVTKGRVPGVAEAIGMILTLVGIAVVVTRPATGGDGTPAVGVPLAGVAAGAVSGICQAVGALLAREATESRVAPLFASWLRLGAGVVCVGLVIAASGRARATWTELRPRGVLPRLGVASFLGTVCGLWLSQIAVAKARSTGIASTLLATSPLFALPLAHVTKAERVSVRSALGSVIAVTGVAILLSSG